MNTLGIVIDTYQNNPLLRVAGNLVKDNLPEFTRKLEKTSLSDGESIYLNFSDLENLDSMALGTLVYFHTLFKDNGNELIIQNPAEFVLDILERSGLSQIFSIEINN